MTVNAIETLRLLDLLDRNDKSVDLSPMDLRVLRKKLDYYFRTGTERFA
jgi:hypothetical protein